ncbi:MAG: M14 family metallopeptidase [Gemmatimonadota bacterium]|nr:M14 family metallopeptidase [Gemmatimonadota bacterium]
MLGITTTVRRRFTAGLVTAGVFVLCASTAIAQGKITSPKQQFGFNIGDDYKLANYTQFEAYWRKLAKESPRMKLVEIGKTAEGRTQLMSIISSPANLAKLDHYKEISHKLAFAEGVSEEEAHALAKEGKSIVWIDGGLHATEVLGAAQLIETVYQLLSKNDAETMRFLNDCIILAVHANPDGMELVSNWYMKDADTLKRNTNIPRLYQKYIGHDDNRDFYISNQPETQNLNHVLYWDWFPQIVYNHHQTGPAGTVMFAPPFRDPFNFNFDPLIPVELDLVAASMHSRFEAEGKPGVTMRSGSSYSTWWNGGLRTTVYFHNQIGLLTEAIGNPTPEMIPFIPEQQLPRADLPYPIAPQKWHFRQSIEYELTANRAVLDIASRERENLLFNFWRMGRNSIDRGNRDTWTASPSRIDAVKQRIEADAAAGGAVAGRGGRGGGRGANAGVTTAASGTATAGAPVGDPIFQFGRGADMKYYTDVLHAPALRDPRGYILPSDQPDFPTATKFVNALLHVGVIVNRATAPFTVAGKQYPAGSYVVKSAQAFRPHVLDMFEPQDHPNDFAYPGGPPKRPYDNAGYTLAYQMGVKFDRILEAFDGPFARIPLGQLAKPMPGTLASSNATKGYLVMPQVNDGFILVNRALKANAGVYRYTRGEGIIPAGTFYIAATPATTKLVTDIAKSNGINIGVTTSAPPSNAKHLHSMRVALYDVYGGSMPSGHTRWLLEQFEFPFDVIYPPTIDGGNLASKYDVIILPSGALPRAGQGGRGGGFGGAIDTASIPAEFRARMGRFTVERTVPQLKQFMEAGGTVVAVGTSANLGMSLGLPMTNALVEKNAAGVDRDLPGDKYYVPGSILQVQVDTTQEISAGLPRDLDVFFDNSPAYRLGPDAAAKGVRPLAIFPNATPLRSGWAWGQAYLNGTVEAVEATIGKGKLYMFAPEITFRGQPHGTFKWLFNSIYAGVDPAPVP